MKKFIFLYIILILFLGCSYGMETLFEKKETVTVRFPVWPPQDDFNEQYPPLSRWKITVRAADISESFYTNEERAAVCINRNRPFCMIVQPITVLDDAKESDFFKPAGFIYPWDMENESSEGSAAATWEQGFLARQMNKLFCDGKENHIPAEETEYLISTFNWKKAAQTIEKKAAEGTYNPWLQDSSKILEGITAQDFKAGVLNIKGSGVFGSHPGSGVSHQGSGAAAPPGTPALLSSYIPENARQSETGCLTIKKGEATLFSLTSPNTTGVLVKYESAKKVSLEFIFLPIYIEDI